MPRVKFTPFLETQTTKSVDSRKRCNEQHVRLTRSMVVSDAFKSLNGNALYLYIMLRLKFYKEEKNKQDFEVSKSYGVKLLGLSSKSENTIRRSLKELVEKGFLDQTLHTRGGGTNSHNKINKYRFSSRWKNYKANK